MSEEKNTVELLIGAEKPVWCVKQNIVSAQSYRAGERTHEGPGPVLQDGPALFGLQDDGHDPPVVLVMEAHGNLFFLVDRHVWVDAHQLVVHLVQFPWKKYKNGISEWVDTKKEIHLISIFS